eukprot:scaffold339149_cov61-Attheya_sp.AAC.1
MPPDDDPCTAMLAKKLLVRATIIGKTEAVGETSPFPALVSGDPNEQSITYHYAAEIEQVFLTDGRSELVPGNTIEVRSPKESNLCGIEFQTGDDMLLELNPSNAGHYSSNICGMNSLFEDNNNLQRHAYNECFEPTSCAHGIIKNQNYRHHGEHRSCLRITLEV